MSLSGELTSAVKANIRNKMRASAKKALAEEKEIARLRAAAESGKEAVELKKGIKHLEEAAGIIMSSRIVKGKHSKRTFDINNCGGEILNLDWQSATITQEGLEIVKKHLSRFENTAANRTMIKRLEKIKKGEMDITDWDKRFYTHEIREYERYRNLGYAEVKDINIPEEIYNNAHTATLEDYKIYELTNEGEHVLYHPEIKKIDFFPDEDRLLLE